MSEPFWTGSKVVVTGASSGIGAELARGLAERCSELWLVARRRDRLEELATELRNRHRSLTVRAHECDMRDSTALDQLVERVGPVDVLVNNAGVGDLCFFERAHWSRLQGMIDLNVTASLYLTHRLLPSMIARGFGGVLLVSSMLGHAEPPGYAVYVGTKHFISGFAMSLRAELAGTGVRVTQLCPGPIDTEFEAGLQSRVDMQNPNLLKVGVVQCAREALEGFAADRARVVPGRLVGTLVSGVKHMPAPVYDAINRAVGKKLRSTLPPAPQTQGFAHDPASRECQMIHPPAEPIT